MDDFLSKYVKNAICYVRKSRDDADAEARGEDVLLSQRTLITESILPRYSFNADIVQEIVSGDSIKERPVFQQLIADIKTGKYQAIVCKDLTRLGRGSYSDMGVVYDLIKDRRIFVITAGNVYDPKKSEHLQHIRFNLFFAREEYEMIKQRLQDGKDIKARLGNWVQGGASVPDGYEYDPKTKKLKINEERAKVVRTIFDLYSRQDFGAKKICTHLQRLGITTPTGKKEWHPTTILKILERKAYIGYSYFRIGKRQKEDGRHVLQDEETQIWVADSHEALIDLDTWNMTYERLENSRNLPSVNYDFTPSELASLVTCKSCGKTMARHSATERYEKKDGSVSNYRKLYLYCRGCSYLVGYSAVEEFVLKALDSLAELDDKAIDQYVRSLGELPTNSNINQKEQLKYLKKELKEYEDRLLFVYEQFESRKYSPEMFEKRRSDNEVKIEELKNSILFVEKEIAKEEDREVNTSAVRDEIKSALTLYEKLGDDKAKKNKLLRELFSKIELTMIKKASRYYPEEFELDITLSIDFLAKTQIGEASVQ